MPLKYNELGGKIGVATLSLLWDKFLIYRITFSINQCIFHRGGPLVTPAKMRQHLTNLEKVCFRSIATLSIGWSHSSPLERLVTESRSSAPCLGCDCRTSRERGLHNRFRENAFDPVVSFWKAKQVFNYFYSFFFLNPNLTLIMLLIFFLNTDTCTWQRENDFVIGIGFRILAPSTSS